MCSLVPGPGYEARGCVAAGWYKLVLGHAFACLAPVYLISIQGITVDRLPGISLLAIAVG